MGLQQSPRNPCLFTGVPTSHDYPADTSDEPIIVDLYVDDFIYFGLSDDIECQFKALLSQSITVMFMGVVNWFLGTHFTWIVSGRICPEPCRAVSTTRHQL